jgi:NuA3 HAT complex component NTO1
MEDEVVCDVCAQGGAPEAPIVTCATCRIAVHAHCYGNPLLRRLPSGPWTCEQCKWGAQNEPCVLCPSRKGPMKRTTDFRWAHLACAMWIPEVFFRYGEGREPIDCLQIARRRWTQVCCHCKQRYGACIECSHHKCKKTFHVTCGMNHEISLEYQENEDGADVVLAFCAQHAKKWEASNQRGIVIPKSAE